MWLPIVGLLFSAGSFLFINAIFWVLILTNLAPDWVIIGSFCFNFLLGVMTCGFCAWLKDEITYHRIKK